MVWLKLESMSACLYVYWKFAGISEFLNHEMVEKLLFTWKWGAFQACRQMRGYLWPVFCSDCMKIVCLSVSTWCENREWILHTSGPDNIPCLQLCCVPSQWWCLDRGISGLQSLCLCGRNKPCPRWHWRHAKLPHLLIKKKIKEMTVSKTRPGCL